MKKLISSLLCMFMFTLTLNVSAEENNEKFEKFKAFHKQMTEERMKNLETRHQKKIAFENEMYELEKTHLNEVASMHEGIQPGNHDSNMKMRNQIKEKMRSFHKSLKEKREAFHKQMKSEREAFRDQMKEKRRSMRGEFKKGKKS